VLRADSIERSVLVSAVESAAKARFELDRRLARMIITELSEALRRGRR
jgi:hypothetical protein